MQNVDGNMKVSAVEYMAKKASENFKLKDMVFSGFDHIDIEEENAILNDDQDFSAYLEIWANVKLSYEGIPPESYRVLNKMLQDWVDEHEKELKTQINPKLTDFLKENYKDIDLSDLNTDFDDYIWEDQVDYMPEIDEDSKEINFVLELVLEVDEDEAE